MDLEEKDGLSFRGHSICCQSVFVKGTKEGGRERGVTHQDSGDQT